MRARWASWVMLRTTLSGQAEPRARGSGVQGQVHTAHQPDLHRLDTAATGGLMVAASYEGLTQIFRQDVLFPITEIPRKTRAVGVAISPDSRRLAICDHAGTLSVHDLPDGKLLRTTKVGTGGGSTPKSR